MKSKKLVCGVGINDIDGPVTKYERVNGKTVLAWACPYYISWSSMLNRCYDEKLHKRYSSYIGCRVCEEWLYLSSYKEWMRRQGWKGKVLDKDLLVYGNKVYAPDRCIFIDQSLNKFLLDAKKGRGRYLIGVTWDKQKNKYKAACCNPFTKKSENLGAFLSEIEAHNAWKARKSEIANIYAEMQTDPRIADALRKRFTVIDYEQNNNLRTP